MANPLQSQALDPLINEAFQQYQEEVARLRTVVEPAVAYYQAYMAGGNGGCTNPVSSGSHDDHDCLVSLHARMLAAVRMLGTPKAR